MLIAAALVTALLVKRKTVANFTQSVVYSQLGKLTSVAMETGAMTSLYGLLALACFLAQPHSNVDIGIIGCLGRLYTLTLLYNLHLRSSPSDGIKLGPPQTGLNSQTATLPPGFESYEARVARLSAAGIQQLSVRHAGEIRVHTLQSRRVEDATGVIEVELATGEHDEEYRMNVMDSEAFV